jgi:hypothetical protein
MGCKSIKGKISFGRLSKEKKIESDIYASLNS